LIAIELSINLFVEVVEVFRIFQLLQIPGRIAI
jgi:hypothetical protein